MPHLLVAGKLHPSGLDLLQQAQDVTFDYVEEISESSYQAHLPKADGMVTVSYTHLTLPTSDLV